MPKLKLQPAQYMDAIGPLPEIPVKGLNLQ
jgi:hypothetical protein